MIQEVLQQTSHRPWELPKGQWVYYQEWNRLLFFHFEVDFQLLRELVPSELELDSFQGKYYISVVPFTMEKIRPRFLPSVGVISNFDEINVRTYVSNKGKQGVYFLNIEAAKALSAFVAKSLSGLPYEKAQMKRSPGFYSSSNNVKGFSFKTSYEIGELVEQKTPLQIWLTERYCLYILDNKQLYRYEIHHKPWDLYQVSFTDLHLDYNVGSLSLSDTDIIAPNYSPGVVVLSWAREKISV